MGPIGCCVLHPARSRAYVGDGWARVAHRQHLHHEWGVVASCLGAKAAALGLGGVQAGVARHGGWSALMQHPEQAECPVGESCAAAKWAGARAKGPQRPAQARKLLWLLLGQPPDPALRQLMLVSLCQPWSYQCSKLSSVAVTLYTHVRLCCCRARGMLPAKTQTSSSGSERSRREHGARA